MRHRYSQKKLQVTSSHRKAMLRNLSVAIINHERIVTTVPKAKMLRSFIEPLITLSKNDSVNTRRALFNILRDRSVVSKLCLVIGKRFTERPGGYTRILKYGFRPTDNAARAIIELVDYVLPVTEEINKLAKVD
ncbi:MAG: 50S ribosomal protein L17 [Methylacidiphilales bacterium]|nr:50S ribosomal protein L17 [Candidatus Methylacidiphilales bacterium]